MPKWAARTCLLFACSAQLPCVITLPRSSTYQCERAADVLFDQQDRRAHGADLLDFLERRVGHDRRKAERRLIKYQQPWFKHQTAHFWRAQETPNHCAIHGEERRQITYYRQSSGWRVRPWPWLPRLLKRKPPNPSGR